MEIKFYPHQQKELDETKDLNKVAFFHDMRFAVRHLHGGQKLIDLGAKVNLLICQKSKINDWKEHFQKYYSTNITLVDATKNKMKFVLTSIKVNVAPTIILINYELAFRRPELLKLHDITLLLDESSLIQNETAKRTKFIMKLDYKNLILLSRYTRKWKVRKFMVTITYARLEYI